MFNDSSVGLNAGHSLTPFSSAWDSVLGCWGHATVLTMSPHQHSLALVMQLNSSPRCWARILGSLHGCSSSGHARERKVSAWCLHRNYEPTPCLQISKRLIPRPKLVLNAQDTSKSDFVSFCPTITFLKQNHIDFYTVR